MAEPRDIVKAYSQLLERRAQSSRPSAGAYSGLVGALAQERGRITNSNPYLQASQRTRGMNTGAQTGGETFWNELARGLMTGVTQGYGTAQVNDEYKDFTEKATQAPLEELENDPRYSDVYKQRQMIGELEDAAIQQSRIKGQKELADKLNQRRKFSEGFVKDGKVYQTQEWINDFTGQRSKYGQDIPRNERSITNNMPGEISPELPVFLAPGVRETKQKDGTVTKQVLKPSPKQIESVRDMHPHFVSLLESLNHIERGLRNKDIKETDLTGETQSDMVQSYHNAVLRFAQATGRGANFTDMEREMIKGMLGFYPAGSLQLEDIIKSYKRQWQGANPLKQIRTTMYKTLRGYESLARANATQLVYDDPEIAAMYPTGSLLRKSREDWLKEMGSVAGEAPETQMDYLNSLFEIKEDE